MDKFGSGHATFLSRGRRHSVALEAIVGHGDSETASSVTDLSLDGCCLSGDFRIGERIIVRIPKIGQFPAHVRWALLGRAGVRFERSQARPKEQLSSNAKGAAAIEYALLASLIALALLASISRTGDAVGNNWNEVNQAMPGGVEFQTP